MKRTIIPYLFQGALCVVLLSLAPCARAASDTVTFTNGDRITGHLKTAGRDSVAFSGDVTRDVTLAWKDIRELNLASANMLLVDSAHPQGIVVTAPDIAVSGTSLTLTTATPAVAVVRLADLVSLSPQAAVPAPVPPSPAGLFRAVGGALKISPDSILRATQKQISLAGAFDVGLVTANDEALKHQETIVAMEANYTDSRKPGGAAVINQLYSGTFQQNIYLSRRNPSAGYSKDGPYFYALANEYHNLSLGMNLAQSYGGGLGWGGTHGGSNYNFAADLRYVHEMLYAPGHSFVMAAAGLTEDYSYTFQRTGITIGQHVTFIPAIGQSHAYQVRGTAILDIPISKSLSIDFTMLDDYIANAPPKNLPNFAKYSFSLKYTIGAPKSH